MEELHNIDRKLGKNKATYKKHAAKNLSSGFCYLEADETRVIGNCVTDGTHYDFIRPYALLTLPGVKKGQLCHYQSGQKTLHGWFGGKGKVSKKQQQWNPSPKIVQVEKKEE